MVCILSYVLLVKTPIYWMKFSSTSPTGIRSTTMHLNILQIDGMSTNTSYAPRLYGQTLPGLGRKLHCPNESSSLSESTAMHRQGSKCTIANKAALPSVPYVLLLTSHWFISLYAQHLTERTSVLHYYLTLVTGSFLNRRAHGLAISPLTASSRGSTIPQDRNHLWTATTPSFLSHMTICRWDGMPHF